MENLKAETRAGVLVEALPYLQEYNGKIVVVKYGGNAMINEDLKQAVIRDIVLLNLVGVKVVLVHGGGPEIGELLKKTGKESKFIMVLLFGHFASSVSDSGFTIQIFPITFSSFPHAITAIAADSPVAETG